MKKIMVLFAAAALVVACGGSGSGKKDAKNNENQTEKQTVEQIAADYAKKILDAQENDDFATLEKLANELEAWGNSLSEEDQMKADAAMMKVLNGGDVDAKNCEPEDCCCEPETVCCEPVTDCCEPSCGDDCTCDVEAIASKVRMLNDKMMNAIMNNDLEAVEKITAEGEAWFESLSEEELAVAEAAQAQWEEENAEKLSNL